MKRNNLFLSYIVLIVMISILVSCGKTDKVSVAESKTEDATGKSEWTSKLRNDSDFLNSLHILHNETNGTYAVVKGDGTMILNSMRAINESFSILDDVKTKEPAYITKTLYGDSLTWRTISYGLDDESNGYQDISVETVFYDKDGKEVGLRTKSYAGQQYALGDNIIYSDGFDYEKNNMYIYNVKTAEKKQAPKANVSSFNSVNNI